MKSEKERGKKGRKNHRRDGEREKERLEIDEDDGDDNEMKKEEKLSTEIRKQRKSHGPLVSS